LAEVKGERLMAVEVGFKEVTVKRVKVNEL